MVGLFFKLNWSKQKYILTLNWSTIVLVFDNNNNIILYKTNYKRLMEPGYGNIDVYVCANPNSPYIDEFVQKNY